MTKLTAVKTFVLKNKVAIIAVSVATMTVANMIRNQSSVNEFLTEKGLIDEFYNES
jgi:predicted TIM-barrel enzyme